MTQTILTDSHHKRADAKLIASAIKKGWNIPDRVMDSLPEMLADMVENSYDERSKVAAAKVLVSMHGQNMKQEEGPRQGPTINVGVQVDARVEQRRTEICKIAEGIRARRISQSAATE